MDYKSYGFQTQEAKELFNATLGLYQLNNSKEMSPQIHEFLSSLVLAKLTRLLHLQDQSQVLRFIDEYHAVTKDKPLEEVNPFRELTNKAMNFSGEIGLEGEKRNFISTHRLIYFAIINLALEKAYEQNSR